MLVGRVINCTGPDYSPAQSHNRWYRRCSTSGLAAADPSGSASAYLPMAKSVGADGRAVTGLYYIGP